MGRNDFGLWKRTLRKAMEERTIIGELMIFQRCTKNHFYSVFAISQNSIKDNLLFPHNLHSV